MARDMEITKSIWIGTKFVSIGSTKQVGNEVFFKKVGGLPGLNPYVPILANAGNIPFQERNLWQPGIGDTGDKVKIYMADLRLDKYFSMINPQEIYTIKSLKNEVEAYRQQIERLFGMLYDLNNDDRLRKRVKREIDMYNQIRGYGYGFNQGYQSQFPATQTQTSQQQSTF